MQNIKSKKIKPTAVQYKDYIHKNNQKLITESIINHKITSVLLSHTVTLKIIM